MFRTASGGALLLIVSTFVHGHAAQQRDVRVVVRAEAPDGRFLDPNLEDSARDLERALRSGFREFRPLRVVPLPAGAVPSKDLADIEVAITARHVGAGGDARILTHTLPDTGLTAGTVSSSQRVVLAVLRVLGVDPPYELELVGTDGTTETWTAAANDLSRQVQRWLQLNHERLRRQQ